MLSDGVSQVEVFMGPKSWTCSKIDLGFPYSNPICINTFFEFSQRRIPNELRQLDPFRIDLVRSSPDPSEGSNRKHFFKADKTREGGAAPAGGGRAVLSEWGRDNSNQPIAAIAKWFIKYDYVVPGLTVSNREKLIKLADISELG